MKRIVSILFSLILSIGSVYAISPADSIRREMNRLRGKELLQAHSNLCQLAATQDDMQYELRCIREFLAEALKQKDAEAEGMARVRQLYCYYNYDNLDSILFYLPASLKSMKENKTWDYYYNAWSVLVERYIYEEKLQTALLEAQKMYADAHATNSNYGLGISSYDMGCIYQTMGRFREAEKSLTESIAALSKEEDISQLLSVQTQQADFLLKAGRYKEAAELYHEILPHKDRMRTTELANQLDELHTIFEVDELTLRNEVVTTRFYLSLFIGILLLLALVLYIIQTRRLRRKNRALYDSILQSQRTQDKAEEEARTTSEEQLDHKSKLYRQLCELMQAEELYKDTTLNRDILAERLCTNSVYLADAVHKYADGATINEFINSYRLRRAASLLTENPKLNINEVEYQSGFNSRSTFNRCFRAYYGMSPSEYKTISKEKKIGK